MTFTLYSATIPSYQQVLGSVSALCTKAAAWCAEKGVPESDILGSKLAEDMLPFTFQVAQTASHSARAIEAVQKGVFSPVRLPPAESLAELKATVDGALATIDAVSPDTLNALVGRDMRIEFGEVRMDFTVEDFLLSFSLPNFYFHATTAYDLLRSKGLEIGKRDFMGAVRLKKG